MRLCLELLNVGLFTVVCVELLGLYVPVYYVLLYESKTQQVQVVLWRFLSCGFSIEYIHS